jgi:tetratricopeptide (TPR) repeat protein
MKNLKVSSLLAIVAIAGSLFLTSCGEQKKPKSGKELYSEYFTPFTDPVRGSDDVALSAADDEDAAALKEMKAQGMAAYGSKNYAGCIKFFEDYLSKATNDLQVPFYLGISYMATENQNKAEGQFNRLLQSPNGLYYDNSQWYAALIAIDKAEYAKAKDLLTKVVANKNHTFQTQAEELLDQVEYLATH